MHELRAEYGQGYLFSRSAGPDRIAALLEHGMPVRTTRSRAAYGVWVRTGSSVSAESAAEITLRSAFERARM